MAEMSFLHRSRISEALRGRKFSEERKRNISEACKGRKAWNAGLRKATHPHLIKYGNAGSKHWAWKGGISRKESRLRQTSEYKSWRDSVFQRDNFTCQFCKKRGRELNAHHIISFSKILEFESIDKELFDELIWNPDNGYTLCLVCHKEVS